MGVKFFNWILNQFHPTDWAEILHTLLVLVTIESSILNNFFFSQRPPLAEEWSSLVSAIKANYCRSFGLCRGHHEQANYVTPFQTLYLQKNVLGRAGNRTRGLRVLYTRLSILPPLDISLRSTRFINLINSALFVLYSLNINFISYAKEIKWRWA